MTTINDVPKSWVVVAEKARRKTPPIPDDLIVAAFEASIVLDDNGSDVIGYYEGRKVASTWGPAADRSGEWFAYRDGSDTVRVAGRDAGLRHMLGLDTEAVSDVA